MRSVVVAAAGLMLAFVVGCDKQGDDRLYGTWVFDRAFTQSQLPEELTPPPGYDSHAFPLIASPHDPSAKMQLVQFVLDKLEGITVTITPDGFGGMAGSPPQSYEIVARGDATWTLKMAGGHLETVTMKHDRLAMPSRGDIRCDAYFARMRDESDAE